MQRKWDTSNEQLNQKCIDEIITRIEDIEDTEQVGIIAAQDIIDIVLDNLAPEIYNKGVNDAKKLFQEKFSAVDSDIELLKQ